MKKKIPMLGNTDDLRGVPVDMSSFYSFFTSPVENHFPRNSSIIFANSAMLGFDSNTLPSVPINSNAGIA